MKDEIKEILEALKPHDEEFAKAGIKEYPLVLNIKEQKILLDYITNLQEENKKLKEDIRKDEIYFKTFELAEECDQKQDIIDDYILRNKKLNNIINELEKYLEEQWLEWKDSESDGLCAMANEDKSILNKLKELKGSDE